MEAMGQQLLYPPNVSGWRPNGYWVNAERHGGSCPHRPADSTWAASSQLLERRRRPDHARRRLDHAVRDHRTNPVAGARTRALERRAGRRGSLELMRVEFTAAATAEIVRLCRWRHRVGTQQRRAADHARPRDARWPDHARPRHLHRRCTRADSRSPETDPHALDRRRFLQLVGLGVGAGALVGPDQLVARPLAAGSRPVGVGGRTRRPERRRADRDRHVRRQRRAEHRRAGRTTSCTTASIANLAIAPQHDPADRCRPPGSTPSSPCSSSSGTPASSRSSRASATPTPT